MGNHDQESLAALLGAAGLSDKESLVYLTTLRLGTRPTSAIAKRSALNRGTAYVVLHALLSKGLVSKSVKNKVQYFSVLHPSHLIDYVERRKKEIHTAGRQLAEALPYFTALMNPLSSRPRIQFFEGTDGARTVIDSTIAAKEKTLRAFLSLLEVEEFIGADYFEDYTKRRIKSGYTLHALRTLEKDKTAMAKNIYARSYITNAAERREVRYVPEDMAFPISMYLYDDTIAIVSSHEENFALLIESRELSQMQKKLFDLVWAGAICGVNKSPAKKRTKKAPG